MWCWKSIYKFASYMTQMHIDLTLQLNVKSINHSLLVISKLKLSLYFQYKRNDVVFFDRLFWLAFVVSWNVDSSDDEQQLFLFQNSISCENSFYEQRWYDSAKHNLVIYIVYKLFFCLFLLKLKIRKWSHQKSIVLSNDVSPTING